VEVHSFYNHTNISDRLQSLRLCFCSRERLETNWISHVKTKIVNALTPKTGRDTTACASRVTKETHTSMGVAKVRTYYIIHLQSLIPNQINIIILMIIQVGWYSSLDRQTSTNVGIQLLIIAPKCATIQKAIIHVIVLRGIMGTGKKDSEGCSAYLAAVLAIKISIGKSICSPFCKLNYWGCRKTWLYIKLISN